MRVLGQKHDQKREQASSSLAQSKAAFPHEGQKLMRATGNRALRRVLSTSVSGRPSMRHKPTANDGNPAALPKALKAGVESLSGTAMDNVRVHYNSAKPAEVRALAYTRGRDIYIGPGQEKQLPHEAWHVVQQSQGRVGPTAVQLAGVSINSDPGLEREADVMGAKASVANSEVIPTVRRMPNTQSLQRSVMQLAKVPTGLGTFNSKLEDKDDAKGKGVNIELTFDPEKAIVDATKIALVQSIRSTTPGGTDYTLGVTKTSRMVPSGKPGGGYSIDAEAASNNPIYYNAKNLGPTEGLKDTPMAPTTDPKDPTLVLLSTNYRLGYCYKSKTTDKDKDKKTQSALLIDKPRSHRKGASQTFETAALAIEGKDKDKYYGSVKWGYKLEGTDAAPTVAQSDITLASPPKGKPGVGTPTENFLEAAKVWNLGESQGTLQIKADIRVKEVGTTRLVTLARGVKVKQIAAGLGGETPTINAEVLKPDGSGTGVIVGLPNWAVEDLGGGLANKPLPIPAATKPVKKP